MGAGASRCALDAWRAAPQGETPKGCAAPGPAVQSGGGDPARMPPGYLAAVQSCRT